MNRLWEWLFGVSRGDLAGAEGWSLRLTGMPANAAVLLGLFALFAGLGWLVVRCYRREGTAPQRVKMTIAALRLAALALVFLVLLQPALVVRFTRVEADAVAVLIDDTLSMRWRDRYTDEKQRAALAGLLRVGDDRLVGEDRLTRAEAVSGALARQGGALDRLTADHPVLVYRFGVTGGSSSSYIELIGEAHAPGDAVKGAPAGLTAVRQGLGDLKADGRHTDLGRAVREALNRLEGRRLAGLVVVSDGRNTGLEEARLAGAIQVAAQRGVPLYAVAVGDPVAPQNVAITQLLGPREARAGSKMSFTALITHRSMPKTATEVRLWRSRSGQDNWEDTGIREDVLVGDRAAGADGAAGSDRAGALQEVTLTAGAPAVGTYVYQARIRPPRGDSIETDNEARTVVRVTDQKMKVLLVASSASWEFQFLRNFLLRSTEHYAVTAWQQNADQRFNQDASTGMKRSSLPTSRQEMVEYDVVVLCDPRHVPGSFDERLLELLDEFVGKYQGGLCYLAGNKFTGRNLARRGALEALGALLPVVLASDETAHPGGERRTLAVELTSEGQVHPALRLALELGDSVATWRRLPEVYHSQRVARLKPLASALAVCADAAGGLEQQTEPLMAVQHYGRGRVLFLGFDGTWRWRAIDDASHYERFWSNTMEFLGSGRLEKNRILVTTAGDTFDAGTDIEVRVEAYDRDLNPLAAKGLLVEMRPLDAGEASRHSLRRDRPGLYVGTIRADRVGAFELDVPGGQTGAADWTPQDVSTRRIQVRLPQAELRKPEADHDAMRELAGSEARFALLHEVDALAGRIPAGKVSTITESPHPLWSTQFMLILFGALLLTEWTLRKIYKMM